MEQFLVQSEKMAALGMMISGMAHEIKNPNNFISFNMPILKEYLEELMPIVDKHADKTPDFTLFNMPYNEFRDDLDKLLKNIEAGSNRINNIVSYLKKFSEKREKVKKDWLDIHTLIEKVALLCSQKINGLVGSFEINVVGDLPQVYTDPEIVELILLNFLTNAAKAADKKDSWIKLNVFFDKKKGRNIAIEVKDNGSGISEADLSRIFDPFFSTKLSKGDGGMGLYLCQTLADEIGAQIEVETVVGEGSVFRLLLNKDEL